MWSQLPKLFFRLFNNYIINKIDNTVIYGNNSIIKAYQKFLDDEFKKKNKLHT